MKPPEPVLDSSGVPQCTEDCGRYDGKRCELLGYRPSSICEPAVRELVRQKRDMNERLDGMRKLLNQIEEACEERLRCDP